MPRELYVPILAVAALAACGGDDDGDGVIECDTPSADRYLPLVIGATWTYDTSDMGQPNVVKTSTVEALEDVGERKAGTIAYRVRTGKAGGLGDVVSWQQDKCTSVVRHREQNLDPITDAVVTDQFYVASKLRVDETPAHLELGATWTTSYTEVEVDNTTGQTHTKSKDETWTVQALDESVTTAAGTFTCLKVNKTTSGLADKTYWFAKGVGKVQEMGEAVETLTAYTIP
jgi:hypothetical protein